MEYTRRHRGVCSRASVVEINDDGIITAAKIIGGCDGNNKGMAALAEGRTADDVIRLLSGIPCGKKPTSCPDQLAKAVALATGK